MPLAIHPRRLAGPWTLGYALDFHTVSSTFVGNDAVGRPEFDTKRTPIGEMLYRLKNHGDATAVEPLAEAAASFIGNWPVDAIVPIPPSNTARRRQPVIEVARAISKRAGLPLCANCVRKVKSTGQLKDVSDRTRRLRILVGAFAVDPRQTQGCRLLVFDDLFRSGATVAAVTRLLLTDGAAMQVRLLTSTQTRKKL